MAIHRTTDKRARGLAAALLTSDIPPWEFDIRAVEPGTDPVEVSDWRRRVAIKAADGSAASVIDPVRRPAAKSHGK